MRTSRSTLRCRSGQRANCYPGSGLLLRLTFRAPNWPSSTDRSGSKSLCAGTARIHRLSSHTFIMRHVLEAATRFTKLAVSLQMLDKYMRGRYREGKMDTTAGISKLVESERHDQFIPVRKEDLFSTLIKQGDLADPVERELFWRFART